MIIKLVGYIYRLEQGTPDLPDQVVKETLAKAFDFWGRESQLTFRMEHSGDVDILVKFGHHYHGDPYPFDGPGQWSALTYMY